MSIQKEYNINGKVYRLVEETPKPKKREPIKAWCTLAAGIKTRLFTNAYDAKAHALDVYDGEVIELHEILEGHKVISREMLAKAWDSSVANAVSRSTKSGLFKLFCIDLGFTDKGAVDE